jgi:amino acid adenylation domain-containing protein/FkbH-like protein
VTPQEHLLVLVIHEIAADASSFEVLFRELARIYASTSRGRVADLPQLPIQYTDFAAWQLQQFKDRAWSEHLEFWKRQLSGAPALLELPTDFPRPASQTYRADTETRALSPALIKDLRAFSERHGTSDFTVFLAALAVLLHRYSRQDDILIGTPVTSRDHPEFEGLMGNFANLLLLRTDTSGDPTASELLERTREVSSTAWRRQKLPFETLLDELRPARDQSYHPLCQVLFSRTTHGDTRGSIPAKEKEQQANAGFRAVSAATEVCGLSMSLLKMEQGTTKYDLNFEVSESAGGLAIRIEYATDLFQGESMRRMLGHWEMLVKAMIAEPSRRLSTLPMLTREEERLLLEDWTRTERPYPKEKTLSNMFEEQVARTPEAVALVSGNTRLTYQELQARATAVADRLRSMGIGHESLVGICLERSWELIAGILGVLQTGAAYVPLDPAYPKDRLAFILQDAKLQALITEDKLLHVLPAGGAPVLCIKDINWEHSQNVTRPPKPHVSRPTPSTSLAYVIYTSGSTGQPKGVALEHRNAVAMVSWAREVFSQEELSGVLASTSVCFDLSIFEMFVPLSWGGKVILAENALALATLPAAKEVRLINTVPSAIRELLRIKAVPDSVRVVNLAGEPLATSLVNEIYEKTATQKVYDLYGPTETTTYSTYTLRKPNERASIGRPLANEQVYLLDGSMHPVPIGVPGDLYIGGAGVTRGYLNRPQMTAERFVAHPFKMGARIYKTGDLARWRPDGNLEFLGRSDHQVKIRGFRIELGEIEVVLKKYPAVQEVVVVAREDKPGDKRLVAYVVVHKGQTATSDDLRNAVRQSLPEYMTPSAFVLLDALPLTPNGKVDRKALPAPDQERSGSGAEFVAPRTPVEEQLAGIWREVLGVPQVGIHDSFFDLGGHSLLAVQAISRIREIFAIELPLLSLFDASTIASLAEGLSSNRWARAEHPVSPLQRVARDSFLPVSFVQERLWFLDQLEPGSHAYNVPTALRLIGPLDLAAFVRALDEVVSRHEALRTSFKYQDGHLTQVIAPPVPLELRLTDLRSATIEDREEQARRWVATQAQEPFDLARGPLFRASLAQLSETEHILTVVTHHSVSDGWSMALFFKELGIAYQSFSTGQPAQNLPELPVQYADFAHWQRNWMTGEVLEKELVFWKERLMGAPAALELPTDHLEPEQPTRKAGRFTLQFPEGFAASVLELSQREGSTPFMVLMSALTITLHQWTTQQDMVIGTVVAGRNRRELENVIGCFMNFLPIRARISEAENGQQILAQLRESILQAQSHQDCPFEKLVEAINPERRLNQNPLYNVALLLQNFPTEPFQGPSLRASPFPVAMEAALLDLRFEAEITEQNLSLLCEYKTELFELSTIDQLLAAYQQVLQVLITKPETSIEDFPTPSGLKSQAVSVRGRQAKHTLAISATFTAEPVADSLRYWMAKLEVPARIEFAPYHQVFQQLLDPSSLQATNSRGLNVVLLRLEDWQSADAAPGSVSTGNGENPIEHNAREFVMALKSATERSITPFLICFCPASRAALANPRQADLFVRVEQALVAELEKLTGVYTLQSRELSDWYPVADYDDPSATALGHVPYTPIAYTALGTAVARKFQALNRVAYKVVVLDCDQTLWSGVCGEDGPTGIRLDPPRQALQNFMRARHESGMLLCLCSKNSEQDVEAVFKQRLDMALRREHFVAVKLNWNAKSENIKALAEELNLGLNSFIFVDDNPLECAEVEANCPEVLTLLLPEDTAQISQFLQHCWAFDHLKLTTEDRRRAEMYRQNHQREQLRAQTMSLSDFLAGLELKVSIEPMSPPQLPRIAQLTQRTNQFNFTTRRHTENSLQKVPAGCEVLSVQVRDRFGDYGLAGAMIYSPKGEVLEVDSFLLSCRVLGRGVEHGMLARLGAIARERQLKSVELPFFPTERNKPALDFLENIARSCPECRQASNGSVVYRVPVEFAAQIHFDPQNDPADKSTLSVAPRDAISTPAASPLIRLSRFREIALSANDAAKIHEEMEAKSVSRATSHTGYAPPNTDLEHKLCQLWQGLLHLERVGIHDNFFELGGHSLLAVRLFVEVEKITGQKFPLVTLFQAPTIERLAGVLSQSQSASPHPLLVPVQPNGSKPPLILVHGAGGDVLWGYANLAAHLPADQPVYGIKSRGQTGVEDFRKIEDMANWYVQQLRAFQPHGPYYLGGYCFGGNVAYEMARMLSKDGEEVALLALLDTAPANAGYERIPWWRPSYVYRFARNVSRWIEDFNRLQPEVRRSFARRKARVWGRKLRRKFSLQRGRSEVDLEDVIEFSHFPEHELKLWHIHLQALADHQQQPYEGEVTLLRTQGQPLFCSLSEDFCWSKLAKGVRIKVIPGSHEDIFVEPNVSALAKELEVCLEQAQARFLCETPETQLALCQNTL